MEVTPCPEAFKRKPSKLDEIGRWIQWSPERYRLLL